MPILNSADEDTALPHDEDSQVLAGQRVDCATDINPNHRRGAGAIQQDRASVVEIPGLPGADIPALIDHTMSAAVSAARNHPSSSQGNSTITMMVYNPVDFTLDVGSKGDTAVFLIVHDNDPAHKTAMARLSDVERLGDGSLANHLTSNLPMRRGNVYGVAVPGYTPHSTIPLEQVIDALVQKHGLDASSLQAHLVLTSDGIPTAIGAQMGNVVRNAGTENAAARLIEEAIKTGDDNFSAVVLRDIKKGQGTAPVAACICDGFFRQGDPGLGHHIAQAGVQAFQTEMQRAAQHYSSAGSGATPPWRRTPPATHQGHSFP